MKMKLLGSATLPQGGQRQEKQDPTTMPSPTSRNTKFDFPTSALWNSSFVVGFSRVLTTGTVVLHEKLGTLSSRKLTISCFIGSSWLSPANSSLCSSSTGCCSSVEFCSSGVRLILARIFSMDALILLSILRASSTLPMKVLERAESRSALRSPKTLPMPLTSLKSTVTEFLRLSMTALIWKASLKNFSLLAMACCVRSNFSSKAGRSMRVSLSVGLWKWASMQSGWRHKQGCAHPSSAQRQSNRCMVCRGQQVLSLRRVPVRFLVSTGSILTSGCVIFS